MTKRFRSKLKDYYKKVAMIQLLKQDGFSDVFIGGCFGINSGTITQLKSKHSELLILPEYKIIYKELEKDTTYRQELRTKLTEFINCV